MMKLLSTGLCALSLAHMAFADEATKRAKIDEILLLTDAPAMYKQMSEQAMAGAMSSVRAMMQKTSPDLPKDALAMFDELTSQFSGLFQERKSWESMKPGLTDIYASTLTEVELAGMIEFYRSPLGQAFLKKMPGLASKTIQFAQKCVGDLMPQIAALAEKLTEQMKAKYSPK
jgi:hypothetical protein